MTFVITAKFVIMSILSAQKLADRVFFIDILIVFFRKTFVKYPHQGDSNKYTKLKELFKNIRYSCFGQVDINFLYNSKFDFTAKSFVTNTFVISRVLCTCILTNVAVQY